MARIRSIKPEIRTSEKVNSWPVEVRYFWIMLWGYVDDHGKGRDNAKLIVADTYPLDDKVGPQHIEKWMDLLEQARVIRRYEVGGTRYFLIVNWGEHQRPSHPARSVVPDPPQVSEDSGNPPEGLARIAVNGSPEQRAVSSELGAEEQGADRAKRGTRIPEPFVLTGEMKHWAAEKTPDVDVNLATQMFVNHWRAKTGRDATKRDWTATWENWLLKDQMSARPREKKTAAQRNLSTVELFAQMEESA